VRSDRLALLPQREEETMMVEATRDSGPVRSLSVRSALPWVATVARLVVAGVLIVAGWLKMGAPAISIKAVEAYEILPQGVAEIVGYVLPILEIVIGALLIVGLLTRVAAVGAGLLMLVFITGIGSAWARGLNIDCGCFGGGGALAPGETAAYLPEILRDLGLLALAAWIVMRPPGRVALDSALGLAPASPGDEGDPGADPDRHDDHDDHDDRPGRTDDMAGLAGEAAAGDANHEERH
jgi:uncharacterized membrane protein YphA (DoxX/SURF4 family)